MTADAEGLHRLTTAAETLLAALPAGRPPVKPEEPHIRASHVGIAIPADVCYVAKGLAAPPVAEPLSAPLFVLAKQLSNGYLYRRIRVQGGAYGGSCRYDPAGGLFAFLSYRDPHLTETLDIFRDAAYSACNDAVTEEEVEKALIATIGALDRPWDPAGRGYPALIREFSGLTDPIRRRFREAVLGVDPECLQETARRYFPPASGTAIFAVCAPEARLRQANEVLEEKMELEKLI